jgi:predicted phage tail protein
MTDPASPSAEAQRQERSGEDVAIRRRTIPWRADAICASWLTTFLTAAVASASLFTSGADRARH